MPARLRRSRQFRSTATQRATPRTRGGSSNHPWRSWTTNTAGADGKRSSAASVVRLWWPWITSGRAGTAASSAVTGTPSARSSSARGPRTGLHTIGRSPASRRPRARSRTNVSVPVQEPSVMLVMRTRSPSAATAEGPGEREHVVGVTEHGRVSSGGDLPLAVGLVERLLVRGRQPGAAGRPEEALGAQAVDAVAVDGRLDLAVEPVVAPGRRQLAAESRGVEGHLHRGGPVVRRRSPDDRVLVALDRTAGAPPPLTDGGVHQQAAGVVSRVVALGGVPHHRV